MPSTPFRTCFDGGRTFNVSLFTVCHRRVISFRHMLHVASAVNIFLTL